MASPAARPKAYIQAGLHADEIPGMLSAHHLIARLDEADRQGAIRGEIIVVPVANPIGLDQYSRDACMDEARLSRGRISTAASPILSKPSFPGWKTGSAPILPAMSQRSGRRCSKVWPDLCPANDLQELRRTLLGMAIDADFVFDLHCDLESLMHMYTSDELWPEATDLAAQLGCRAVMLAERQRRRSLRRSLLDAMVEAPRPFRRPLPDPERLSFRNDRVARKIRCGGWQCRLRR